MEIDLPHRWAPRDYQLAAWEHMHSDGPICYGKRAALVWHRRAGKDLFGINLIAEQAVQRIGLYWHLFPTYGQGRKVAWEGMTKDGRRFLDHFPKELIESTNDTEMRLKLKTGSVYQVVGAESPDRLVGSNPVGVIPSEYSVQEPMAWRYIQPILAENNGWAMFVYTPRGHNHGYDLYEMAKGDPNWLSQKLTVEDTRAVPLEEIQKLRDSGMSEQMIQQEFYCAFEAPLVGAYYATQMEWLVANNRITDVPWEPQLPVHTAWDLGMNDMMSIWFYQKDGYGAIRLIDYYENSGEGLAHYSKKLKEKPYDYGTHTAPHDITVRELGTGKSRLEVARSLGIRFRVARKLEILDGIEAVRNMLPKCWFDKTNCKRGIQALKEYRKEKNELLDTYRDSPLHDWTSHASDSFRTLAVGNREAREDGPRQEKAIDDWKPFG